MTTLKQHRCFGGTQGVYRHEFERHACAMEFAVYLPPQAERGTVPVLYWLSGLTCTWANFTEKAGVQRDAAEHGLIVVAPDTSPRGAGLPGEHDAYDFGSGAGFYVDATEEPWARHYRMYSYVTKELPAVIDASFPADRERQGIFGHSMGGHGALICALKNPDRYRSLSAFAPICRADALPLGREGVLRLSRRRPRGLARLRREPCSPRAPAGRARSWSTRAPPTTFSTSSSSRSSCRRPAPPPASR